MPARSHGLERPRHSPGLILVLGDLLPTGDKSGVSALASQQPMLWLLTQQLPYSKHGAGADFACPELQSSPAERLMATGA